MTFTLADAIRAQFERDHPHGKNTLFCAQCRRTKDRNDFRETPWHGRAADCKSCEGMRWTDELRLRQAWELEQERAKVAMLVRHIGRLRFQRMLERAPKTADVIREYERPLREAIDRRREHWSHVLTLFATPLPDTEPERRRQRARLTLRMERTR
ncbi:hypothetical protein ABZ445_16165 [Streptomyces chartreusis]|uniref:hypothetical protein n=1 Tax=Streptomyces chartreusis TaxID=1969 RepID=UPI0033CF7E19